MSIKNDIAYRMITRHTPEVLFTIELIYVYKHSIVTGKDLHSYCFALNEEVITHSSIHTHILTLSFSLLEN